MSANRSITGAALVPYQRRSDHIEAAKHLRLTVTRYIADRASLNDIHGAVATLVSVAPVGGEPGYRGYRGKRDQGKDRNNALRTAAKLVAEASVVLRGLLDGDGS